jgi:hypothetical protein
VISRVLNKQMSGIWADKFLNVSLNRVKSVKKHWSLKNCSKSLCSD